MFIYLILLLALALRLVEINQSFWLDEAIQVLESNSSFSKVWQIPADFHPPLFHYLAHFWLKFGNTEWFLRLLPVIFGLGSIYFSYLLVKKISGNSAALVTALFLATSPFHIYYSQEFRPYMLSCFLATVSFWLFFKHLSGKDHISLWFVIINALGLYSLYFFPFVLFAQLAVVLAFSRKRLGNYLLHCLASFIFFIPWIPMFITQLTIGRGWASEFEVWRVSVATPVLKSLPLVFAKFWLGNISFDNNFVYGVIIMLLLLLTVFLVFSAWKKEKIISLKLLICLLVPIITAFIVSLILPVIAPKRLLLVLPVFYILLSLGSVALSKRIGMLAISIVILINISCLFISWSNPRFGREQWREAIAWVENHSDNNSVVLFEFSAPFGPWTYYQKKNIDTVSLTNQKFGSIENALLTSLPGKDKVFLFQYVYQMTDPGEQAAQWLNNNYRLINTVDFPGVGFIYEYIH